MGRRHLVDENILDRISVCDWVAIEDDCGGGGAVERGDYGAVFIESRIE
jgi:hypothetical protein